MNILILNYEFPPLGGGAGNATYYILKEFAGNSNIRVDLVTSSVDQFKIEDFSSNIKIHYLDINKKGNFHYQTNKDLLLYSSKAYKYSKKLIKKAKYDLVHAFFGIPCGYIAMKLGLPYLVSLRGSDVPFYNKRFYWLDKLFFKRLSKKIWYKAKLVVANSQGLKELALNAAPYQDISTVYNGIDIDGFKPIKNKAKSKKLTIVSTGRLIQRKGYEYLIKALEGLGIFKLQLIGDGNLKENLASLAKSLNVDVQFLGKVEHNDVIGYLQKADLFALPSLNEGMSNSLLEAMACGLPVVVTDVGGSKELVNDNGFVVQKHSVISIKNALNKYLDNPELLIAHGKQSRKITESMSWNKIASAYYEAYKKCVV